MSDALEPELFAKLLDHLAHPVFVKDRAFRFVFLNRACCDFLGFTLEEMLGKTDFDLFPPKEAQFFRDKDVEVFSSQAQVMIEEEPITDKQGGHHVLKTTKVPMRDDTGAVTHVVGIIQDITRLKEAEDALRRANDQLEHRVRERTAALEAAQADLVRKERLAVLGQLAGGVAHQIRNPLGAMKNAAYVLERRRALLTTEERHVLNIILDEAERANRIITDLLDYARVRSPVTTAVDPRLLVEQSLGMAEIPERVVLETDVPPLLPSVLVDVAQVCSAIHNLIQNAVEAMPAGGVLTVRGRAEAQSVVLSVADTGKGISAELANRLFEPLVTTKPLGLGLGLVTARTLLRGQGGALTLSSTGATGTTFEVALPISAPA